MAIDRNKTAQQAEKLVAQGKIDAAIGQYELLVRDNPRDVNTINKIGDLYARLGKKREAILQFNKIGEFYAKDGFFLKAIAIYKKITKLDPTHLDSYQRMADLYAQQGLVLEARSGYRAIADQYVKGGHAQKAIAAYRSWVRIDPDNLKPRTALADLLAQQGLPEEAAKEFTLLGQELEKKGMEAEARAAYKKALTAQPGAPEVVAKIAAAQAAAGDRTGAIQMLEGAVAKAVDPAPLLTVLGALFEEAGDLKRAGETLMRAVELAPARTDSWVRLSRVHLALKDAPAAARCLAPQAGVLVKEGRSEETAALLEEILSLDGGNREALKALAETYLALKDKEAALRCQSRLLDTCLDHADYSEARRLAEALVRVRPEDPSLREKLERIRWAEAESGRESDELEAAAASVHGGNDASIDDPLTDEILVEAISAAAEPEAEAMASHHGAGRTALDLPEPLHLESEDEDFIAEHMTEADVFVKYGLGDRAAEQLLAVVEQYPGYIPALQKLKEIYLEEGNREGARQQMASLVKAHLSAGKEMEAQEALAELTRFDPESREASELQSALTSGVAAAVTESRDRAAVNASIDDAGEDPARSEERMNDLRRAGLREDQEEREPTEEELLVVDSLIQQAMRDEAVAALRHLANSCGSHPEVLSRMRAAMAIPPSQTSSQLGHGNVEDEEADEHEEEFEISLEDEEELAADPGPTEAPPPSPPGKPEAPLADLLDLASEIDAALGTASDFPDALLPGVEADPEGHTLEEVVAAFKQGVEQHVATEDYDTHYNLGIAYKEMGLIDEAIGEFQYASKSPQYLVDACSMLGICFREKSMPGLAVKWYRRGIEAADSKDEESVVGLRYELAVLLVEMGEPKQAMDLFTEVFGINSKYRDVAARIKELERTLHT